MTTEEIKQKAEQLSAQHNCKVHPLVFQNPDTQEQVIGFLKEPPRIVKLRYMDKAMMGSATAGAEVIDAYLIKEESDSRIYVENSDFDSYYLGAIQELNSIITLSINQFKKK